MARPAEGWEGGRWQDVVRGEGPAGGRDGAHAIGSESGLKNNSYYVFAPVCRGPSRDESCPVNQAALLGGARPRPLRCVQGRSATNNQCKIKSIASFRASLLQTGSKATLDFLNRYPRWRLLGNGAVWRRGLTHTRAGPGWPLALQQCPVLLCVWRCAFPSGQPTLMSCQPLFKCTRGEKTTDTS